MDFEHEVDHYEMVESSEPLSKKQLRAVELTVLEPGVLFEMPRLAFGESSYVYGKAVYATGRSSKLGTDSFTCVD